MADWRPLALLAAELFGADLTTQAQSLSAIDGPRRSLMDLSIEELLNEKVTSVSKKATKLSESPAAVSVITQEDIRRSGALSIAAALGFAVRFPGLAGDTVLVLATLGAVLGESLGPAALRRALTRSGEIELGAARDESSSETEKLEREA